MLLSAIGVLLPLGIGVAVSPVAMVAAVALGDRAVPVLGRWKDRLVASHATIMAVLFLVFGAILVGKGLPGLG